MLLNPMWARKRGKNEGEMMNRTRNRSVRSGAAALAMIIAVGFMTRAAHAQMTPTEPGPRFGMAVRRAGFALGAALALELLAPRFSLEIEAGELPPSGPPPAPPPPCCYAPPPSPPPMMMFAPSAPPEPEPLRYGLAVSGLFQYPGSGQSPIAGMAASLQVRTSPRSLFGLELQSLASDRPSSHSQRDEVAGLMLGRLFAWDAAFAPYLELAGGLDHVSIDTQALEVTAQQFIGRVGLGVELRLGPHLIFDTQVAQVHRLRLDDQPRVVADNDPAFIGQHEQSTELRCGLGYRF
jgi:hypothetical protein